MAKAKPKAAAKARAALAAQLKAQPKKVNPFELKTTKGHFDTIGKRVSGKKQNVITARQDAVNRRKKTLLVEYRQLRKANTFVDRRFGESDPNLTESDKGLARLQAQRLRQAERAAKKKRGSKFTLADGGGDGGEGEEEALTHMGRSLADDIRNLMDRPEFDDLDQEVVEELVASYHFGGGEGGEGAEGQAGGEAKGTDGKPKTRKQIMEEIIAKSRMYRALKAKQREEDEAALEAADAAFKDLVRSSGLASLKLPPGARKLENVKAETAEDRAYDVAARELAFEGKGAAGDRTLTAEELVERERQRLEKLEKERLKRMQGGADSEEEGEGESDDDEEDGGRRKRRREMQSGDALGDDYDSEGGEDEDEEGEGEEDDDEEGAPGGKGMSELDKRRMRAAAGDHPLQEKLREVAAALAAKHGVAVPRNPFLEEGEEGDSEEGEEDEDEEGEEGESGDEGEEEEGESGDGEGSSGEGEEEDEEDHDDCRRPQHPASTSEPSKPGKAAAAKAEPEGKPGRKPAAPLDGPLDLPYTIPLPKTYGEFASLVNGRPAEDLHTAIARIRAFNATALATDNKRKMQEFLGFLVQHFALVAGATPLPPRAPSLDVLTRHLLSIAPEVPYYAATVARARLGRMADQQATVLGDTKGPQQAAEAAAGAGAGAPWPSARVVLQLKLFAELFPTSDRRHPVLTPAALIIGKYLNQSVVSNPHEAAVGLCLCSLLTHMAAPGRRTTPEVLVFLRDCLAAFMPPGVTPAAAAAAAVAAGAAGGGGAGGKGKAGKGKRKAAEAAGTEGGGAQASGQAPAPAAPPAEPDPDRFIRFPAGLLALSGTVSTPPPPLDLYGTLGMTSSDPAVSTDGFKVSLLRAALLCVRRQAALAAAAGPDGGVVAFFDQLFAPVLAAVGALQHCAKQLPAEVEELRVSVYCQLEEAAARCVAQRRPLFHAGRARAGAAAAGSVPASQVREYNPRFEDEYRTGRDYDPDRTRAEDRRLKRQLAKERRGAIRELRRDAVFMAGERDAERQVVDAERLASERSFYSELQRQEADMRSGGQGGMNPHLRGKKRK
ncbi:hypothetical protein HYH03_009084 [Edaphochlamys debaryana]|uniref:Nucleolar protein 14 n=1 Tax=Edaphochlamys debaryana TaxID=47281 RepID=A0A836BYW0_9CHLO|nr:hypothetical protein HYH03_009084 [Edaphochlamys debaryana]|eukprot:KAG2492669.1 hypothetical protein HYH03_009084 [Edaphochlamys debaryana]